jgi:hypothetical protein
MRVVWRWGGVGGERLEEGDGEVEKTGVGHSFG